MNSDPILNHLNQRQVEAVVNTDGPSLVFAGAGSGKTRVLTHRIAYILAQKKTTPDRILAVTFTNKAANEMRERLQRLLGEQANWVSMGTFHSINARLLRQEAPRLGVSSNFTIYDSDDSLSVVKEAMKQLEISKDTLSPNSVRSYISWNKQQFRFPNHSDLQNDSAWLAKEKRDIYERYQKILRKNEAFDFDDLLVEPVKLFQSQPEILKRYQHRWDYILVDEYQDTNLVQFMFLELLSQRHQNICVVGDDDQSIYSWRGAEIRHILEFENLFSDPQIVKLEQNYRSTKKILRAASAVVAHNSYRHPKELWTDNADGENLDLVYLDNAYKEADFISSTIQRSMLNGSKPGDYAILYRTNAQSRALEEGLRNRMIPYVIIGGTRFYERMEIKDMLAYLRVMVNPSDGTALLRIINTPSRKIGKVSLDRLADFALQTDRSIWESLQYPEEAGLGPASRKIRDFLALMVSLKKESGDYKPSEFVRIMLDRTGLIKQYQGAGATEQDTDRIDNMEEFVNGVIQFENQNEGATLEDFLQEVSLLTDIDQLAGKNGAVVLMTLHSAKGLEFPRVFLPGLEEGLFPLQRGGESTEEEREEERRLFYVGITRAMEKVYISSVRIRLKYGMEQYQDPSSFLAELPEDCISIGTTARPAQVQAASAQPRISRERPATAQRIFTQTSATPSSASSDQGEISKGMMVSHKIFGRGKVLSIQKSDQRILKIAFSGGIVKAIAEKFVERV